MSTDKSELESLNTDWMGKYKGSSELVLYPTTTRDVSLILKYCNSKKIAVVPQGGNTGLVGGSVPVHDEIILSMKKMNNIRKFDQVSGSVIVEAGTVLQALDDYLNEYGYMVPLDLGAKGSCQIGGNIATNAGGLRLLRYGSLHGNVIGLEVVLPDGEVISQLNALRKDNTGYDLKQLFIGSEGTLGVITAASILCPPKPKSKNVVFLAANSFEDVQKLFAEAKKDLCEILSAFEFLDSLSLDIVLNVHNITHPLSGKYPFYVLIETQGSNAEHDKEKLNMFLERVLNNNMTPDGTIAQDEKQAHSLWKLREDIPESLGRVGKVYKYDLSLPLDSMYQLVEEMKMKLEDRKDIQVVGYGHLGDSNLHLNIIEPVYNESTLSVIEPFVYEFASVRSGSISAEHGIGQMKNNVLFYSRSLIEIGIMKKIKEILDPNGIMNPYKVIPTEEIIE